MRPTSKRSRIKITEAEGQLGRLAVERGLLNLEQFMEILGTREAEEPSAPLDLYLISAGYLTEEQAEALVKEAAQATPPLDRRSLADACRAVGEPAGRGPSGVVLRCRVPEHPRPLALKIVSRNSHNEPFVESFARAAKKAATIEHSSLTRILEVELRAADLTIVSEFVEGTSILDRVRRSGPLKIAEAVDVLLQVAGVLAAAHKQKLIHGNLKPENVFLKPDRGVKVGDFGQARAEAEWLKTNADKAGTLVYSMAPEQWSGPPGPPTDLYACGVLWHLLLTADFPFKGRTFIEIRRKHEEEEPPPPSARTANLPPGADAIARKLLRKDIKDRYASAVELLTDLERFKKGEPLGAEQKTRLKLRPRPKGYTRRPGS